nr:TolC family protein [Candidatus Cloacimonas sp.]
MKPYLTLILLLPVFLTAGEYTLDQMIEHGLRNSYQVQKNELSSELSESILNSAKWNLIPDASLNAGISQDLDPVGSASGTSSSAGFGISKNISLNDPAYFAYKNAKLDRETAEIGLNKAYQDYAYEVFQAYLETLSASKRKAALEENLAIQTRVWEQSKVLQQLGKSTPFEVKQAEIAVMNSRISIMQLENTIANSRSNLFAQVQMTDEGYPLRELEVDISKDVPAFSTEHMAELRLLEQEVKQSEISLKQNTLDFFPKLSLGYNFSRSVSGADFEFDKYNTSHGLNLNASYSLWNFFTNGETKTRVKINQQMLNLSYLDAVGNSRRSYENMTKELEYLLRLD